MRKPHEKITVTVGDIMDLYSTNDLIERGKILSRLIGHSRCSSSVPHPMHVTPDGICEGLWEATTTQIREEYIYDGGEAEFYDPINGARQQREFAGKRFDRWLKSVRGGELREAAAAMRRHKDPGHWNLRDEEFPADQAQSPDVWLERRADRIERGE